MKQGMLRLILFVALAGLVMSGCATTASVPRDMVRIDNQRYVSLLDLCARNNVRWTWDGFSPVISLRRGPDTVHIYIGSRLLLFNGQVKQLSGPVRMHQGTVVVPVNFSQVFIPVPVPVVPERPVVPPIAIRTVVIDPGHGGKDPGAVSKAGLQEKDVNLDVALRLKQELSRLGITVHLTRDTDEFIPLEQRAALANRVNADFFISIHANAARNTSASGFEAFFLSPDHDDLAKAVAIRENAAIQFEQKTQYEYSSGLNAVLWDMILNENRMESVEMAEFISAAIERQVNVPTRYIKGANFLVLKGARMPAVLLEMGYLSHPVEAAQLGNAYYRQMLAEAIAGGMMQYKRRFEQRGAGAL